MFTLHSLRFLGVTTIAAGRDLSKRGMKRGGRWKFDADRVYTCDHTEDSKRVSGQPVVAREGNERQPGAGTAGGRNL